VAKSDNDDLKAKIRELEAEVQARENDLAVFRKQLASANNLLEGLISKVADEVRTAAQIQKVLVPTEFPNIPGFEFSTKFVPSPISGGDYFDIFEHEDRLKFGVVLASSNGYGMSALLLSVLLKMTGQHEAKRGLSPDKVLQYIASELEPSLGGTGGDRANVFYGIIDRRTLELTYASAGPVYGGIVRGATGKLERITSEDGPIEKGSHLKLGAVRHLNLEARDRVFLVSGGTVAAKNKADEAFGEDRLIRSILATPKSSTSSIHDVRNEIFYRVESHVGEQDLPQDVTAVVFEVKDRVIRLAPRRD
jgi:phosphoserine phosphatase RsbU/P